MGQTGETDQPARPDGSLALPCPEIACAPRWRILSRLPECQRCVATTRQASQQRLRNEIGVRVDFLHNRVAQAAVTVSGRAVLKHGTNEGVCAPPGDS
jgi:hypothetical protein